VPYQHISRIDRSCSIIQRFRLGHKTYVYDLESPYRFLASCQSKPSPKMDAGATAGRSSASSRVNDRRGQPPTDRGRCTNDCCTFEVAMGLTPARRAGMVAMQRFA
jgi:hypothetical protein